MWKCENACPRRSAWGENGTANTGTAEMRLNWRMLLMNLNHEDSKNTKVHEG